MVRGKEASQQMRQESQAHILAAARKLFAERGYFNCKVSDIARQAGMSQGNIYWYYPSKEDILKAILAEGFDRIEAITAKAAAHPGDSAEKLNVLLNLYLEYSREHADFAAIFISILGHGGAPFLKELGFDTLQIGMRYHQRLGAILEQAQAEGVVADVPVDSLAVFYFSFFNGLLLTYRDDWQMVPEQLIRDAVLRLLGARQNL